MTTQQVGQDDLAWFSEQFQTVSANIERVIQGKRQVIELIVMALLSEGHVLVEDVHAVLCHILTTCLREERSGI